MFTRPLCSLAAASLVASTLLIPATTAPSALAAPRTGSASTTADSPVTLAQAKARHASAVGEVARVRALVAAHTAALAKDNARVARAVSAESHASSAQVAAYNAYRGSVGSSAAKRSALHKTYVRAIGARHHAVQATREAKQALAVDRGRLTASKKILTRAAVTLTAATALVSSLSGSGARPLTAAGAPTTTPSSSTPSALAQAQAQAATAAAAFAAVQTKVNTHTATLKSDTASLNAAKAADAAAVRAVTAAQAALSAATGANLSRLTTAYWNAVAAQKKTSLLVNNWTWTVAGDRDRLAAGQKVLTQAQAALDSANALVTKLTAIYGTGNGSDGPGTGSPTTLPAAGAKMGAPTTYAFSGNSLSSAWSIYKSPQSDPNQTRSAANVVVAGTDLHLKSQGLSGSGVCLCGSSTYPTTPYGRYEVRAKMNPNADHGAAIMLWPNSENWPIDGEIDLAEFNAARDQVMFTIHYGADNSQKMTRVAGDFTQWHNFRVDWTSTGIVYYIDDQIVAATTDKTVIPTTPMHLSMQAGPNSNRTATPTSTSLDIAWVKVSRPN